MKKKSDFRLFGILGYPLGHTLSPAMQEAAFQSVGIKAFYLVLELAPANFRKALRCLSKFGLDGFNVTVPYKEAVCASLKDLTPEALAIGAVNTVYRKGSRWAGANTDVSGFLTALKKEARFSPRGKRVLVFGAGGSARAVIYGLCRSGASKITIANRHTARAKKIAGRYKKYFPSIRFQVTALHSGRLKDEVKDAELVVNCTSVGLKVGASSILRRDWIPGASVRTRKLFFDLVYRPGETPFLKAAKSRGHRVLNGLGMLVYQGARSFEYWTGRKAPVAVMKKAVADALC